MSDASEFYRSNSDMDFLGYDLEQDSRWDEVAGSDFYPDPSLAEWGRPHRSVVCREDFDPAGLPDLHPLRPEPPEVAPGPTARRADTSQDAPAYLSGRRVHPFAA